MRVTSHIAKTDIYDLDVIASSSVVVVVGLRTRREHMIEQEGNLDGLRMPDFMCFLKSFSIL